MGVDLTLLPLSSAGHWSAHDALLLDRSGDLWDEIATLGETEIPQPLWCHYARRPDGETTFGRLEKSPYGERLTWLPAGKLLTLAEAPDVKSSWRNRAVWAYLAQMPEDYPVVLYWH